nr:uncharacterized mitochondrial protein AtMg00810-like [Tanacetum cinerariifolium]
MGELTLFLGLQVKQKKDGIFISQDKYIAKILKKFGLSEGKSASTPIDADKPLLKDSDGEDVDVHTYRSMIVKRIFRYLKGKPYLGLWYPKDLPFDLVAYSDSDYAGASLDKKSTTGGCKFLRCRLISWQCKKQTVVATSSTEAEYVAAASGCAQVLWIQNQLLDYGLQALVDKKKIVISEVVIREILQLDDADGVVCLPNEEIFTGLAQMGYEKPTSWNEFSTAMASAVICLSKGLGKGSQGLRHLYLRECLLLDNLQRKKLQRNKFKLMKLLLLLLRKMLQMISPQAPPQGAEFPTQIQQVLNVCSALTKHVENLENDNAAQKLVIIKLKARVKRLEKANMVKSSKLRHLRKVGASRRIDSSNDMEDVFNQGRMIDDMDKDERIELVKDADIAESGGRHDATKQAKKQTEIYHIDLDHSSKVLSMQEDDSEVQEVVEVVTTAKLITDVFTAVASRKEVIIRDPKEELSLKTHAETPKVKDKGKGILVETPKPMKKKDQIKLDAEYARKLHEEINRDHDDFNKDIDWDAAMDHVNKKCNNPQYIKRYQGMKKRPQTESEARKNMMIYFKNTTGYKIYFFKGMTYAQICPIFQARFDENMRFLFKSREEMEEEDQEIIKSPNETPAQKASKRRKLSEEAQEAEDLRKRLEVVDDDDVFVEATPLARKVPVVDYHIVLVDNKPRFKIIK